MARRAPTTARPVSLAPRADAARLARTFPERTLENELQNLKRQIRENEHIWNGFRRVELQMIGAHSLREVITNLVQGLPQLFPRVERVTLACLDPDAELTRLMGAEAPGTEPPFFVALSPEMLASLFPRPWRPRLGPMDDAIRHLLFPGHPAPLASMALTPLVLRAELIGCLNQASREAAHFQPDTGTDLLEHMAAVTAMCLDNAVSHERLKIDGLTDPLTGLYNRRFFERRLREELDRWARRRDSALACMLVDVDHFKCVNDRYGHPVGDRTLQGVARLLGIELRGSDVLALRRRGVHAAAAGHDPGSGAGDRRAFTHAGRTHDAHRPEQPGPAGHGQCRACLPRARHHARGRGSGSVAIAAGRRRALPRQAGRA